VYVVIGFCDKAYFQFHVVHCLVELLQKAYFKCAHECFDRSKRQEEISNCVENCNIPLTNAQQIFDTEMGKFQVNYPVILLSYSLSFSLCFIICHFLFKLP